MKYSVLLIVSFLLFGLHPNNKKLTIKSYKSEALETRKIADHVYQHISFLDTENFGKVPCNGMIVFDNNEAVVFDTPPDDSTSRELINWVKNNLNCKIKAIIPTHFHEDCLGGLEEFHKNGIPSYANRLTVELAKLNNSTVPQNKFDKKLELKIGNKKVLAVFLGEGHTRDNVIGYFPDENVLFGGCLIKEKGAGKGNLQDANTIDWPMTIAKLKEEYPNLNIIIPGHGNLGGTELLDYTIKLFEQK
ncbi:subclass B1 metallo-beta-lactamase [Pontibacter silvestris]|uniref:beta-lactamase n=1 Tax=Pontibacter silvestris TaxID=2305183 RepID=A0ABW4WVM6_9BACT|nr:subclass B1 metallo-beta-lactamase [Pontibacter silvestris]MCC9136916.1 subclass B1 metallo-beta-lactamase [Pontibacter silvestris]